jgi:hypothetical protein
MIRIPEIELAFSNLCTAKCFICSRTHGGNNDPIMSWEVFQAALDRMHDIDFDTIQTGGDGDSFLNPIYFDALRELRKNFPKAKIVLYSNFALLGRSIADMLVKERLIDSLFTRVDSVVPEIFNASTGLKMEVVFKNIDYFLLVNREIKFQINYSNIKGYFDKCREVLGKRPYYWKYALEEAPEDEFEEVKDRFSYSGNVTFENIKRSFWAERNDPDIKPERDMPCGRTHCFESVCYIWTDGDVGICGYDDGQDAMIIGNVLDQTLTEIWQGKRRRKMIDFVTGRGIKIYPCINPKACLFY